MQKLTDEGLMLGRGKLLRIASHVEEAHVISRTTTASLNRKFNISNLICEGP